jgi:ACT domain-containing protein
MNQQKEIQFLKPLLKRKRKRKIVKHLGITRDTVSKYWEMVFIIFHSNMKI